MRALVLNKAGEAPKVEGFNLETPANNQSVVKVIAAGINPFDLYISTVAEPTLPRVVGKEGIAQLEDGRRVYFDSPISPSGSIAEEAVIDTKATIELPEGLKKGDALAIGIAGLAGWLPLSWKAKLQPGESVLILGATGVQGQIAVQAAKLLGAGHITAAGRNKTILDSLKDKGADSLATLEGDLAKALQQAAPEKGYDVVVDSLFGTPFSGLLDSGCLKSTSRVVVLGGSAGQEIPLGFRQLQATRGATIAGYSTFFVPYEVKTQAYLDMAEHIKNGRLKVDVQEFSLDEAEKAWQLQAEGPHRKLVILP